MLGFTFSTLAAWIPPSLFCDSSIVKVFDSNMQLCWIGKILGWVRLCSITEPNRSQLNDCSSITERSIDTAGSIMVKKFPDRTYPSKSQYVYLIKCTLKNCLSFLNLANSRLCYRFSCWPSSSMSKAKNKPVKRKREENNQKFRL